MRVLLWQGQSQAYRMAQMTLCKQKQCLTRSAVCCCVMKTSDQRAVLIVYSLYWLEFHATARCLGIAACTHQEPSQVSSHSLSVAWTQVYVLCLKTVCPLLYRLQNSVNMKVPLNNGGPFYISCFIDQVSAVQSRVEQSAVEPFS